MDHTRHQDIFNACGYSATLIGVGGIGSPTALVLAKMGINALELFDDDVVSDVNLATQFYTLDALDLPKVGILSEILENYSDDTVVIPRDTKYTGQTWPIGQIVISAVDSISARQIIWDGIAHKNWMYYIDARMGGEIVQGFVVKNNTEQCGRYSNFILSLKEEDVPELPCTEKATYYTGTVAAGLIGWLVGRIVSNRRVPYFYNFNLDNLRVDLAWE